MSQFLERKAEKVRKRRKKLQQTAVLIECPVKAMLRSETRVQILQKLQKSFKSLNSLCHHC